jgi:hypothetical protein
MLGNEQVKQPQILSLIKILIGLQGIKIYMSLVSPQTQAVLSSSCSDLIEKFSGLGTWNGCGIAI